jgi:hypothetical protein
VNLQGFEDLYNHVYNGILLELWRLVSRA